MLEGQHMNPLLAALFGGSAIRPGDLSGSTSDPQVDDGPPAVISGMHPVDHRGLFGLHGTARDILGTLGDAFLVQAGAKPVYGPKRHQERVSDALRGFIQNPEEAFQRLAKEDGPLAIDANNQYQTQSRLGRAADEDYIGKVVDRATRLLGAATKDNYPAVRDQVKRYAAARGVTLPFDLPDEYDEEAISNARFSAIPVDKQETMADLRDWRDNQIGYRRDVLKERTGYHQGALGLGGSRLRETTRHNKVQETIGTGRLDETGRHNQATEGIQSDKAGETVRHNQVREGQQGRALDQYSTGERGNVRRPDPSTFRHRTVNGAVQIQRLVKTAKHPEGEWIDVR